MVKKILLVVCALLAAAVLAAGTYAFIVIKNEAKTIDTEDIYSVVSQKTTLYDSKGEPINSVSYIGGNREVIAYEDIPKDLVNAVVAIEDKTFWEHHGFNFVRMIGAVKERITGGEAISGTSTITQQLARNIYLSDRMSERSIKRKILEAYYAYLLERNLTKEQIMEGYLNTVYFGYNSYGIKTAAENYFDKEPKDLSLIECAAIAALPSAPDTLALVVSDYSGSETKLPVLKKKDGTAYLYNGQASEERRELCLSLMKSFGYITGAQKEEALSEDLSKSIKVTITRENDESTYYTDYVISRVMEDLQEEGCSESEAAQKVYGGGLEIYTCMDSSVQKVLSEEINDASNYASIRYLPKDENGNILSKDGAVILRPYSYYFNDEGEYVFEESEIDTEDGFVIKKSSRLKFIPAQQGGVSYVQLDFGDMYTGDAYSLEIINGGNVNIPAGYTSMTSGGDCKVSEKLFEDYPELIAEEDGAYRIDVSNCSLSSRMRQPQAAAVVIDNETGAAVAMTGGRGGSGKQLFNRAANPRQPGSCIKPIAVYGPALQKGYEDACEGVIPKYESDGDSWGTYITAGSIINDKPQYLDGEAWPKNAYGGYRGRMSFRRALQQSVNVCAVKIFRQLNEEYVVEMLKKNGITSIAEGGDTNDYNAAALALGGMTEGISPLELAAAYATFPNGGMYREPIVYTRVCDRNGNVLLQPEQEQQRVFDEGVAWVMTDILRSVVTEGIAGNASVLGQLVAGKTGTTTDQYDIWFTGFTPKYTMSLWEGNDVNIEMTSMSSAAASFWSSIMKRLTEGLDAGSFRQMPENVEKINGEYYLIGTYPLAEQVQQEPAEEPEEETEEEQEDQDSDEDVFNGIMDDLQ